MAVAVASQLLMTDGDAAFLRVNNRVPAHALAPGEVAAASNCRFEQGKPWPRYGVGLDPWGVHLTVVDSGGRWESGPSFYVTHMTAGVRHYLTLGNATSFIYTIENGDDVTLTESGWFTPAAGLAEVYGPFLADWTGNISQVPPGVHTCAYKRFNDPVTGTDNGILITDAWRDGAGEDGGRGRAWRIYPNNGPQEIPLNGHDVWGTARLIQAREAMLLLRHGNERHYFGVADLDAATDKITLHCAPSWGLGTSKRIRFELASVGAGIVGTTPPAAGNFYYARVFSGNAIKLYQSSADAAADTNALDFDTVSSVGKFYVELAESPAPYFGQGAPNLILEPSEIGNTAFEVGFVAVRQWISITNTDTGSVTAPSHKLKPGDAVTPVGITIGTAGPYYAYPVDPDTITLHTDQIAALTGATPLTTLTAGGTGTIAKTNASGLPMPACREGAYVAGRFWGVNERDTIVFSDPDDFLHFTQYQATLPANQGEAGRVNWILPLGEDALIIGKDQKLIVLTGISGASSGWAESTVTGEYGGIAALAASNVGTDGWFLTRKGVASVVRTVAGEKLAVPRTVSENIPDDLRDVDWQHAAIACSETWNGRYFVALPLKGQRTAPGGFRVNGTWDPTVPAEPPKNNRVLVLNFNNSGLVVQQTELAGDLGGGIVETGNRVDSWEGSWSGDLLTPYAFARLTIGGEERLSFATADGLVCWLHDGWDDAGAAITTELLTRGYFGGREVLALRGKLNWDSFNPKATVSLVSAGVNEEETLAGFDELEYDRTKYLTAGQPDYDPAISTAEQFSAPDREDYSPTAEELTVATVDTHQNITEPFRCRARCTAPQLRIVNNQGSLRPAAVSMQARPVGIVATRKS